MDMAKERGKVIERESKTIAKPTHVPGTSRGNDLVRSAGREAGRQMEDGQPYRTARDSTSIRPEAEDPILPDMPNIPPP